MSVYDDLAGPGDKPVDDGATSGEVTMGKGLFRSKTFWVNAITAIVSVGTYLTNTDVVANNPEVVAIGGTVLGVLNVLLRLLTKEPITSVK
jgi:hypothetical protein